MLVNGGAAERWKCLAAEKISWRGCLAGHIKSVLRSSSNSQHTKMQSLAPRIPPQYTFPPEIFGLILTHIQSSVPVDQPDLVPLLTCALVSRAWYHCTIDFIAPQLTHLNLLDWDLAGLRRLTRLLSQAPRVLVRAVEAVTINVNTLCDQRCHGDREEVETAVVRLISTISPQTLVLDFSDVESLSRAAQSMSFLRALASAARRTSRVEVHNFGLFRYQVEIEVEWQFFSDFDEFFAVNYSFGVDYDKPQYATRDPVAAFLRAKLPALSEVHFENCDVVQNALRTLAGRETEVKCLTFEMCTKPDEELVAACLTKVKRARTLKRGARRGRVCEKGKIEKGKTMVREAGNPLGWKKGLRTLRKWCREEWLKIRRAEVNF